MQSLKVTRRQLVASAAVLAAAGHMTAGRAFAATSVPATELTWLDKTPPVMIDGTTFGVPWPRGAVKTGQSFRIASHEGDIPVQSWPLAFWPDGSLKWTAHAIGAEIVPAKDIALSFGKPRVPKAPVRVREDKDGFAIVSGARRWIVPRKGEALIAAGFIDDKTVLTNVRLVAQSRSTPTPEDGPQTQATFTGIVETATLEQSGPVRAVIKLEGKHSGGGRAWLPFVVRLYFYAGSEGVRIVHSFVFDGTEAKDFLSGIGVTADVPMHDALYDRHIRFTGQEAGVWGEAVRTVTGLRRDPGAAYRQAQIEGRALPPLEGMAKPVRDGLQWIPAWGDFTLSQSTADGFAIRKRIGPGLAWVPSASGNRAAGTVYTGGASGGIALTLKDFWQRAPARLDVRGAAGDKAAVTAWLWSPDAPAMDLRPYRSVDGMDTHDKENQGLNITYEDYEAGWGTAYGIAHTSEMMLWTLSTTPNHARLADMADTAQKAPRLSLAPARLHAAKVFGIWGLPDRSTPAKTEIEDHLDYLVGYYLKQIEQRRWYGFWDYGDVMHSYDADRHVWRYDVGGYAWDNSELSTDMMFWYYFLRTGRADVFRMAEAMTRHTGETDVYHIGPYKGFGTRHGVQHFSDSSKQPRISNAAFRRFYFYLTADERCGDLMRDLLTSDETLTRVDIGRKLPANGSAGGRVDGTPAVGFGTVWGSIISAWFTEWERTGNTHWRTRIANGMASIAKLKYGWFSGDAPYDLKTGTFLGSGDYIHVSHLNGVFGVFEIHGEILELIDMPAYKKVWLDYCRYYNAPNDTIRAFLGSVPKGRALRVAHSRFTALAAKETGDTALVKRAWQEFYKGDDVAESLPLKPHTRKLTGPDVLSPVDEDPFVTTNGAAQWGLAAIADLALIGDAL